jgi:hypothetical protein
VWRDLPICGCTAHGDISGTNQRWRASFGQTVPPYRSARVLILARRTANSPELIEAVGARADRGPCNFTLLVPSTLRVLTNMAYYRPQRDIDAERRITAAVPLLSRAAGSEVVAVVGAQDPVAAVRDALKLMGFDEVIVSLLPARISRWRRVEVPTRIRALGVPVTEVTAAGPPAPGSRAPAPAAPA